MKNYPKILQNFLKNTYSSTKWEKDIPEDTTVLKFNSTNSNDNGTSIKISNLKDIQNVCLNMSILQRNHLNISFIIKQIMNEMVKENEEEYQQSTEVLTKGNIIF